MRKMEQKKQDVVIHIGYPKCASTYLQQLIFPQLGDLSNFARGSRKDKMYVFHRNSETAGLRRLAEHYRSPAPDSSRPWIISCEDWTELWFSGIEDLFFGAGHQSGVDPADYTFRNEVIVRNLQMAWPDAKILIVIREPLSWATSKYRMHHRHFQTSRPIDDFLNPVLEGYDRTVERYQQAFGADRVRVVPFEWLRENPAKFVRAVSGFITPGIEIDAPCTPCNKGPSLLREVELLREKSRLKQNVRRDTPGGKIRYEVLRAWAKTAGRAGYFLRYGNRSQEITVSSKTAEKLKPVLSQTYQRLQELTGLDLSGCGYRVE
jgi:hypothetical protein